MKTLLRNGKIYVERDHFEQAVLLDGDRIELVGSNQEVEAAAPADCKVIDLQGRTVVPGFNDSHMHLHHLGAGLNAVQLNNVPSLAEMIQRGKDFIAQHQVPAGKPVVGRGWNHDYFTDVSRLPNRHDLDQISTEHPVIFTRTCGHMLVCNTKALEMAGIDASTPQPAGAQFDLEPDGYPNGIFRELASTLVNKIIPEPSVEDMATNIKTALDYASAHGITSTQSNDIKNENHRKMLSALRLLSQRGEMTARVYEQCNFYEMDQFEQFIADGNHTGLTDGLFTVGPLKLFIDGSLGARTALMRQDYADEPGTRGIQCLTQEQLDSLVAKADENKIQVATHCIGDRGIEMVLDSYAKVIKNHENPLRHGIVHCQITDMPLVERFKENDILAYVQPIFLHYDMHIVEDRCGKELAQTSYAFGTMGRMGIHVSYGTDCPVEDLNPFHNIYCAVTRKDLKGYPDGGYNPKEKVDVYTAVDNYTLGSAYCSFDENRKGRIRPGYLADLTVLDRDIFTVPEDEIKDINAQMTILAGQVVYER